MDRVSDIMSTKTQHDKETKTKKVESTDPVAEAHDKLGEAIQALSAEATKEREEKVAYLKMQHKMGLGASDEVIAEALMKDIYPGLE